LDGLAPFFARLPHKVQLQELSIPPGNRLEALKGNLKGFYSIRINSQWRIIFQWDNGNVSQVEIIDYHN